MISEDSMQRTISLFLDIKTSLESNHTTPCALFPFSQTPKIESTQLSQSIAFPNLSPIDLSTSIQQQPELAEYTFSAPRANDRELHPMGGCKRAAELRGDGLPDLRIWLAGAAYLENMSHVAIL